MTINAIEEQPGFWNFEVTDNSKVVADKVHASHFAHIHPQKKIEELVGKEIIVIDAITEPDWETPKGIKPTVFIEACFPEDKGNASKIFKLMYSTGLQGKPGPLYNQILRTVMPRLSATSKVQIRILQHPAGVNGFPYYYLDKY